MTFTLQLWTMENEPLSKSSLKAFMRWLAQENWLNEKVISLIDEACDRAVENLPSLSNRDELLKIVRLYVEKKLLEDSNALLQEKGLHRKESLHQLESIYAQQSELVKNQSALIDQLSLANENKKKTISALQLVMVTPSKN